MLLDLLLKISSVHEQFRERRRFILHWPGAAPFELSILLDLGDPVRSAPAGIAGCGAGDTPVGGGGGGTAECESLSGAHNVAAPRYSGVVAQVLPIVSSVSRKSASAIATATRAPTECSPYSQHL